MRKKVKSLFLAGIAVALSTLVLVVIFASPFEKTPTYQLDPVEIDGVTTYDVIFNPPPDWSNDNWMDHTRFIKKVIKEVKKKHKDDEIKEVRNNLVGVVVVNGFMDEKKAFSWESSNPDTIWIYDMNKEGSLPEAYTI